MPERPLLLLPGEATEDLGLFGSAAFYKRIEEVRCDIGCAVIMVSHDLHAVMTASGCALCLNGHVCFDGKSKAAAKAPDNRAQVGTGTLGKMALCRHRHDH